MVDVAHHCDHGRARHQIGRSFADFQGFDLPGRGVNDAGPALALFQLENETVPLADFASDVFPDALGEIGEDVHRHHLGQQHVRFHTDALCQIAHHHRRLHLDDFVPLVVNNEGGL